MAESVHGLRWVWRVLITGDKHNPRGTQRYKAFARSADADAHTNRAGDNGVGGDAPTCRPFRQQGARRRTAFNQTGHVGTGQAASLQQRIRPVSLCDIEPQGARGIRHLTDRLTAELQP